MKLFVLGICLILLFSGFGYAEDDIEDLLAYARNEIFARHGRPFTNPVYQEYFEQFDWYRTNSNYSDDLLTESDRRDIEIIHQCTDNHHRRLVPFTRSHVCTL